jgi:exodeoxyribonuclease V alpha subunit
MATAYMTHAALMDKLQALASHNIIREIDYQFARFSEQFTDKSSEPGLLALVCASLSHELGQGNTCIDLAEFCQRRSVFAGSEVSPPAYDDLIKHLESESFVGSPGQSTPLILDGERLYLQRYFRYEQEVAAHLCIAAQRQHQLDLDSARRRLDSYFDELPGSDDQKLAAALALTRSLVVIIGGPGTGKTTVAARILALLLENLSSFDHNPLIRLAAPTGKAAMRLSMSIRQALEEIPCEAAIKAAIPNQVATIHRLLGIGDSTGRPRFDSNNRLSTDILIVDEVSMIDIRLMAKLLDSLTPACRVILMGDQNQLPSVEAGNFLADLYRFKQDVPINCYSKACAGLLADLTGHSVESHDAGTSLTDCLVELRQTFRFSPESGIARLARAVHEGNLLDLDELLSSPSYGDGSFDLQLNAPLGSEDIDDLVSHFETYFNLIADETAGAVEKISRFDASRVLTPLRQGPVSTTSLNQVIEQRLITLGLISTAQEYYVGRPVLINRNDYNLMLFNGDIGICLDDPEDGNRKVAFLNPDRSVTWLLPNRLPPHETCYAMTIHKSQGSEFDHVIIVLPEELPRTNMEMLNRELMYTAITRARKSLSLFAGESLLMEIISHRYARGSGLTQRLTEIEKSHQFQS